MCHRLVITLYVFIPAIVVSVLFGLDGCDTIRFTANGTSPTNDTLTPLYFGPRWMSTVAYVPVAKGISAYYNVTQNCSKWSINTFPVDSTMQFVRVFDMIAVALSIFVAILWPIASLVPGLIWYTMGITIVIIACQGLTLLMFRSSFCTDNPFLAAYGLEDSYSSHCEPVPYTSSAKATMYLWSSWIFLELLFYIICWWEEQTILRSAY
jgi:hypothetical protein